MKFFEDFWHKTLKRPHALNVGMKQGSGLPIVLLHGLGGKSEDWDPAISQIDLENNKVIAMDLLGFGKSPKPDFKHYSVDDHAASVIKTIKKLGIKQPIVLVGHSMGAVVAARVAATGKLTINHLILYQVPVYADSPEYKVKDVRNKAYTTVITTALRHPKRTMRLVYLLGRAASNFIYITLDPKSWRPFEQSLLNTVMRDSIYQDLAKISVPISVIYGRYDMVVIRRNIKKIYRKSDLVQFYEVSEAHRITKKTGRIINSILLDIKN